MQESPIDNLTEKIYAGLGCKQDLTRAFIKMLLSDITTFDQKNRDYGNRNISQFGIKGIVVRVNDKLQRLITLIWNNKQPAVANEKTYDTWQDLSVYCVIARMLELNEWRND